MAEGYGNHGQQGTPFPGPREGSHRQAHMNRVPSSAPQQEAAQVEERWIGPAWGAIRAPQPTRYYNIEIFAKRRPGQKQVDSDNVNVGLGG
jgi:hypothetical protein